MSDNAAWRELRLMQRLAGCLAAARRHPQFLELHGAAQPLLRLATDRIAAQPADLEGGLPSLLDALGVPSSGTSSPTPRLINSCNSGLSVLKGLNCLGIDVRKASTKRLTVVASQIVVARGITTSKPAIRSFLRSA